MRNTPFVPGEFYHFFNRANSQQDLLFFQERNYRYFMQKWAEYLEAYFEVWSYCLIPNHFHFLLRVTPDANEDYMEQWRRFAVAYTQSINKQEHRRGSLFQEHPKHLQVTSNSHLMGLIRYIHRNPIHHGIVNELGSWRHSSYSAFFSPLPSKVKRTEVLELFGGLKAFEVFHQQEYSVDNAMQYCTLE